MIQWGWVIKIFSLIPSSPFSYQWLPKVSLKPVPNQQLIHGYPILRFILKALLYYPNTYILGIGTWSWTRTPQKLYLILLSNFYLTTLILSCQMFNFFYRICKIRSSNLNNKPIQSAKQKTTLMVLIISSFHSELRVEREESVGLRR